MMRDHLFVWCHLQAVPNRVARTYSELSSKHLECGNFIPETRWV